MLIRKIAYLDSICLRQPGTIFSSVGNLFSTSSVQHDNNKFNSPMRQGKILAKIYGERAVGRKKRWFPTNDASAVNYNPKVSTSMASIGVSTAKGISGGKGNARRLAVLNKLFMQHITSMLATGETSERICNRGLQVTRVKISTDYTNINVYWLGCGLPAEDAELEVELRRCSGQLRHELSQLELMGQVPRIHFVRDRSNANLVKVEAVLNSADNSLLSDTAKRELFGHVPSEPTLDTKDELPAMRNDTFGLNHYEILMKILGKMKKSKQAWQTHKELDK